VGEDPVGEVVARALRCDVDELGDDQGDDRVREVLLAAARIPEGAAVDLVARPSNKAPTTSRGPQSVPTAMAVRPARVSTCAPSAASGTVTTTASYGSQNVSSEGREVTWLTRSPGPRRQCRPSCATVARPVRCSMTLRYA
jgi:hypothetical protein